MKMKERYKLNKESKVGDNCICPSCNTEFVKTNYQQAFCKSKSGTKCKDKYWNTVTPEKRNNTTRISPASAIWSASRRLRQHKRNSYSDIMRPLNDCATGQFQGYTSEGYRVYNGIAFDEFDERVYNVDPYEDDYDHGQW